MAGSKQARDSYHLAEQYLHGALRQFTWEAGQLLNLVEIANTLGISPTPVREAANRLVGATLLEFRRGQGYFVPDPSLDETAELYQIVEGLVLLNLPHFKGEPGPGLLSANGQITPMALMDWMADVLEPSYGTRLIRQISGRLAPVLAVEERLFDQSEPMMMLRALIAGDRPLAARLVKRYFRQRARAAGLLLASRRRIAKNLQNRF